jgi:hypothetical protein
LGQLLVALGIRPARQNATPVVLPFRLRDDFLSPAELAFYRVLEKAAAGQFTLSPKVNLADLFFVSRPHENQSFRNQIDRKHVDFLLCDPATMKPRCGIELDDSSHARRDRQERDALVDQVFAAAGLPLLRVPARAHYDAAELAASISQAASPSSETTPVPSTVHSRAAAIPTCPKCGIPMVKRVSTKGQTTGKPFFGCPNFPKCREIASA